MSHVKSHPGASHLKTLRCVLAYEIIYKTKGIFFLLQGGVGPPKAIFHISIANVIGRTPGGLAWCRAALEAMFLYGGVFSVSLKNLSLNTK